MEKYRLRRLAFSTIVFIVPQIFLPYNVGMFISAMLQWAILLIVWGDTYNRLAITRFFEGENL